MKEEREINRVGKGKDDEGICFVGDWISMRKEEREVAQCKIIGFGCVGIRKKCKVVQEGEEGNKEHMERIEKEIMSEVRDRR